MPASTAKPLTIKLVDVPISVIVPPKIAVYDSGNNSFEGEWLGLSFIAVISDATTAVLLVNDDKKAVDNPNFVTDFTKLPLDSDCANFWIRVVFSIAVDTNTNSTKVIATG